LRNLVEYLRTTAFRIALAYAGLFAASVVILFGGLYWTVTHELRGAIEAEITRDVSALREGYDSGGTEALTDLVRRRIPASGNRDSLYLLASPDGAAPLANLPPLAPFAGWRAVELDDWQEHDHDDVDDEVLLFGLTLGQDRLIVGRSLSQVEETTEILAKA